MTDFINVGTGGHVDWKTQFNHKQASEQIARLYGVDAQITTYHKIDGEDIYGAQIHRITKDLGVLMELAIRNDLAVKPKLKYEYINVSELWGNIEVIEYIDKHSNNNDPIEATRVAIAKALIKKASE